MTAGKMTAGKMTADKMATGKMTTCRIATGGELQAVEIVDVQARVAKAVTDPLGKSFNVRGNPVP